ncbi:unnamed protein product [Urochloa decumbens]|uniref:F-box domain-containing protein n=1 Tax=Urochloa decumbens TaxID=240449 RepID=A0ABC9HCE8_9POAL
MDLPALLPDNVLADVLRRLPPCGLAAARSVCTAWRTAIDDRRLLRVDLLPHSLAGILINFPCTSITDFFSRPSTDPSISGKHVDYLPESSGKRSWSTIIGHCNGLLLLYHYVLNPATRRCDPLPPEPILMETKDRYEQWYLAYDPTVSPHYQVFLIPRFHPMSSRGDQIDPVRERSEWPPSPCILNVFSSAAGRWEERSFAREGEPAGSTIADMRLDQRCCPGRYAVCWRRSLYVHCQTNFVMRISLSNDTYRVIESPPGAKGDRYHLELLLGKSEKGVYCTLRRGDYSFQVWLLEESSCRTQWVPRHEMDLLALFLKPNPESTRRVGSPKQHPHGPWILQDIDYYYEYNEEDYYEYSEEDDEEDDMGTPLQDEELEWSSEASDDDGMCDCSSNYDNNGNARDTYDGDVSILGFHPFREIVFINYDFRRGLAYHLNTSKVEDLGNIYSESLDCVPPNGMHIRSSFPYTPCWV